MIRQLTHIVCDRCEAVSDASFDWCGSGPSLSKEWIEKHAVGWGQVQLGYDYIHMCPKCLAGAVDYLRPALARTTH